jgi:GNAT superfamily N-acetyltransferase
MTRGAVVVRDAVPEDADALCAIWADFTVESAWRSRETSSREDVRRAVHRLAAEPSERLVVGLLDDVPVGVAHLRRAFLSPIHDEDAIHVSYLHVLSGHRRRGVGRSLLETAADWADEKDSKHIMAAVPANARDSNRFLTRLGMAQVAVVRAASVASLRAKLGLPLPLPLPVTPTGHSVVATRRLTRRSRRRE